MYFPLSGHHHLPARHYRLIPAAPPFFGACRHCDAAIPVSGGVMSAHSQFGNNEEGKRGAVLPLNAGDRPTSPQPQSCAVRAAHTHGAGIPCGTAKRRSAKGKPRRGLPQPPCGRATNLPASAARWRVSSSPACRTGPAGPGSRPTPASGIGRLRALRRGLLCTLLVGIVNISSVSKYPKCI